MCYKQVLYLALLVLTFCSCSNDVSPTFYNEGKKVAVEFSLLVFESEEIHTQSRNSTSSDSKVRNIDVLVFDDEGLFIEDVSVSEDHIVQTEKDLQFQVQLTASAKKRTIHIITNSETEERKDSSINLDILKKDISYESELNQLATTNRAEDNSTVPSIMWGRTVLSDGIHLNTKVNKVQLFRSFSTINVRKKEQLHSFEIEGVTLLKSNLNGYVLPDDFTNTSFKVDKPNAVTTGEYFTPERVFTEGDSPSVFLYDRINTEEDYMSVILKGTYKGKSGFYKIVLLDSNGKFLDIIRNHKYILTVTDVNNYGYVNLVDAIQHPPTNALKVDIDDVSFNHPIVTADGSHLLSSSHNEVQFLSSKKDQSISNVELFRLFSSRGTVPKVNVDLLPSWIQDIQVLGMSTNEFKVTGTIRTGDNDEEANNSTLVVTCDNLHLDIDVSIRYNIALDKAIPLIIKGDENEQWHVKVNSKNTFLSEKNNISANELSQNGYSFLSSKYFSNAYVYINESLEIPLYSVDLYSLKKNKLISSHIIIN